MDGDVPENGKEKSGSVSDDLSPRRSTKTLRAMKAPYSVKRITFNPSEANPGESLHVRVPKLNKNEVLVPGSLALRFDIDLSGGHANNYLVQNVSRALVSKQVVNFGGTTLNDIVDYDIYKIFTDLFLPEEMRGNMVSEGIQSKILSQIRSGAGDKPTTGVDAKNKLEKVYGKKYRINLDHQILTDHGVFYPQALYTDLLFELVPAPADQVVKGSDAAKLKYKLTNIQLEYEMIRSKELADEATSAYESGKEFLYDNVIRSSVVRVDTSTELMNMMICIFKCLHFGKYPCYLKQLIKLRSTAYSLRGTNILSLPKPSTTTYGLNSFSYSSVKYWNSLPDHFRKTVDYSEFKRKLLVHSFS